jgi:hypothetical protein
VAPAARLGSYEPRADQSACDPNPPFAPVQVRDGGYVENTGLLTITELLPRIKGAVDGWKGDKPGRERVAVQFVVVSIDDDPVVLDPSPKLAEHGRGALGISKAAGPGYLSRLSRDRLSSCQYDDVTYLRISPRPHLGAHAATGWELSATARQKDLLDALSRGGRTRDNVAALQAVLAGDSQPRDCAR